MEALDTVVLPCTPSLASNLKLTTNTYQTFGSQTDGPNLDNQATLAGEQVWCLLPLLGHPSIIFAY